jgi:hypothetical protein
MGIMAQYNKVCTDGDHLGLIPLSDDNSFNLPAGGYVFLDFYCDNPDCKCKGGMIEIHKVSLKAFNKKGNRIVLKKPPLAILKASWKDIQAKWKFEIDSSQQSYDTANALLRLFREVYKQRFAPILRQHYLNFKQTINKRTVADGNNEVKIPVRFDKAGRNDPCPCGSGEKYKKCCFNKKV